MDVSQVANFLVAPLYIRSPVHVFMYQLLSLIFVYMFHKRVLFSSKCFLFYNVYIFVFLEGPSCDTVVSVMCLLAFLLVTVDIAVYGCPYHG